MKQYEFTVRVQTHLDIKEILWAFASKLKDVFRIISIDYVEVDERPTSIEHHGGYSDLNEDSDYSKIPERY